MHKGIVDYLRFRKEAVINLQHEADNKQLQSIALADEAVVMRKKAEAYKLNIEQYHLIPVSPPQCPYCFIERCAKEELQEAEPPSPDTTLECPFCEASFPV